MWEFLVFYVDGTVYSPVPTKSLVGFEKVSVSVNEKAAWKVFSVYVSGEEV